MNIENPEQKVKPENEERVEYKNTIRFDQLNYESIEELSEKVRESNGVVRVFIHPLHLIDIPIEQKPLNIMMSVLEKKSAPPIIVFENKEKVDDFRDFIENLEKDKHIHQPIYIMPTLTNYSYPKIISNPEPRRDVNGVIEDLEAHRDYAIKGIVTFMLILKEAGVKRILVGGSELQINEDGSLDKCVGSFINLIRSVSQKTKKLSMDLKVSEGTIPYGRKELREIGGHEDLL